MGVFVCAGRTLWPRSSEIVLISEGRFIARRLARLLVVWAAITLASFAFLHLIPGDPVTIRLGEHASAQQVKALRATLGLDAPWYVQLMRYGWGVAHGDLGTSLGDAQPVARKLALSFPATIELTLAALVFAVLVGVCTGVCAAVRAATASDALVMSGVMLGVSIPVFWLGWMLIYFLAVLPRRYGFDLFPISGRISFAYSVPERTHLLVLDALLAGDRAAAWDALRHLVLPAVTLGTIPLALIAKITRSGMLQVLRSEYIRTARAKGLSEASVVLGHGLRNALIPILTVIGLQAGLLLGGAVLTEHIFAWPGIGRLAFDAISNRDTPLINGCILLFAASLVTVNALVDILYVAVNPRIRGE